MKDLFRRKELKYLLDEQQVRAFLADLANWLVPDAFHDYPITSVYLDTPECSLLRRCEARPAYREKLRVRLYETGLSYLEVKKKFRGITHKVRTELTPHQTEEILSGQIPEVAGEPGRLLKEYGAAPVFEIRYHRLAWHWKNDPDLRITLDDSLTWNRPGKSAGSLIPENRYVLEIKSLLPFPMVLARTLSRLEIWPASVSKASTAFRKLTADPGTEVSLKAEEPARTYIRKTKRTKKKGDPSCHSRILSYPTLSH